MLSVHADGENRHRLEDDGGAQVGWIRGRTIRLNGLAAATDLLRAAADGSRAMQAVLRREYPGWPRHEPATDALRFVHDGAYEWVSDGTMPIARIVRPRSDGASARLAIEYVLPSFASEGVAIAVAQALGRALHADGGALRGAVPVASTGWVPDDAA